MKYHADKKARPKALSKGKIVLMKNTTKGKLLPLYSTEKYKVIAVKGDDYSGKCENTPKQWK